MVNGASLGGYFRVKNGFFGQKQAKWGQLKQLLHPNLQTFFDEIIEVKFRYRQTDKLFDTIYGGVWIFSIS